MEFIGFSTKKVIKSLDISIFIYNFATKLSNKAIKYK